MHTLSCLICVGIFVRLCCAHRHLVSLDVSDDIRLAGISDHSQEVQLSSGGPAPVPLGLWVIVQHKLSKANKTKIVDGVVSKKAYVWLSSSMRSLGAMSKASHHVDDATFMTGLSDQLFPEVQTSLAASGIVATLDHLTIRDDKLAFLLTMEGIDEGPFTQSNMKMVRDGVVDQLLGRVPGIDALATTLAAFDVPDAVVKAAADDEAVNGLDISISLEKGQLLKLNIPAQLPEAVPNILRGRALNALIRKLGVTATKSNNIADTICMQLMEVMTMKLAESGLEAQVVAEATDANGKHEGGVPSKWPRWMRRTTGHKMIDVHVRIDVHAINPEQFAENQLITLRDAVFDQLTAPLKGGLEFELAVKFPSRVAVRKCGWQGPVAPALSPPADAWASCLAERDDLFNQS